MGKNTAFFGGKSVNRVDPIDTNLSYRGRINIEYWWLCVYGLSYYRLQSLEIILDADRYFRVDDLCDTTRAASAEKTVTGLSY